MKENNSFGIGDFAKAALFGASPIIGGAVIGASMIKNHFEEKESESEKEQRVEYLDTLLDRECYEEAIDYANQIENLLSPVYYNYVIADCYDSLADIKQQEYFDKYDEFDVDDDTPDDDPRQIELDAIKSTEREYQRQSCQYFNRILDLLDNDTNNETVKIVHYRLSFFEFVLSHNYAAGLIEARRHAIAALGLDNNAEERYNKLDKGLQESQWNSNYKELQDILQKPEPDNEYIELLKDPEECLLFSALPYAHRQFAYMAKNEKSLAGCYSDSIQQVFSVTKYPNEMSFPVGHPLGNSLYYAHPAKPGYYLPIDNADEELFKDKINDFCHLAQCLGATKITFRSIKGRALDSSVQSALDVEVQGGYKAVDASLGYSNSRETNTKSSSSMKEQMYQLYAPTTYPYIPDNNNWYNVDSNWQRLAKQRLEGNMLQYTTRISSRETMSVTGGQMDEVKAAFKAFLAKGNGSVRNQESYSFRRENETEWEISVEFRPLKDFDNTEQKSSCNKNSITPNEQDYLNELKEILADGEISARERRLLDKIRVQLGISEARAKELEESLCPKLTPEEQEYLNEYKEIIAEGEISARDQRFLEKLKKANGISDERAKEIEALA